MDQACAQLLSNIDNSSVEFVDDLDDFDKRALLILCEVKQLTL